jgi:peptidoglycan/xylan/chitin deacetylase (PgdA/CDA1 family)
MLIGIGFHDVVAKISAAPASATINTVEQQVFVEHLAAIHSRLGAKSVVRVDQSENRGTAVFLTMDDGYVSSLVYAAPELEAFGWRAHFFVTTNFIGRPGFLDKEKIRELYQRGHLIGSHSCSHPEWMAKLTWKELVREWTDSCTVLSDLLGAPITVASVPAGYYSKKVAAAAAASGIKVLFTSEPTATEHLVSGCRVLGRYSVRRTTSSAVVGAIAAGRKWPRYRQTATWSLNKAAKTLAGPFYLSARRIILDRIYSR